MTQTKMVFEQETCTDFSRFYKEARNNFIEARSIAGIKNLVLIGDKGKERITLEKSQTKLAPFELRLVGVDFFFDVDIMTLVTSTPKEIAEYITLKIKEVSHV